MLIVLVMMVRVFFLNYVDNLGHDGQGFLNYVDKLDHDGQGVTDRVRQQRATTKHRVSPISHW